MINILYKIPKKIKFGLILSALEIAYYVILNNFSKYPKYVLNFEKKIAKKFNSKFSLTFTNGTTACQSSIIALGIKKGAHVLVSKLTFPSTITTLLNSGLIPVYLDFNENLEMIINLQKIEKKPDLIIISHLYGLVYEIENLKKIKKIFPKIKVIADCSHAHGAMNEKKNVVNISDISFMSLQGAKAVSAGEGGVAFTNSKKFFDNMINLSHPSRETSKSKRMEYPGLNKIGKGRMHPIGAILASNDLNSLNSRNNEIRIKIKIIYDILITNGSITLPKIKDFNNCGGFHYGLPIIINKDKSKILKKNYFKINKFNYPKYEKYEIFLSPTSYQKLLYSDSYFTINNTNKKHDIRDKLFFIDLDWIKKNSTSLIREKMNQFNNLQF